MRNSILLLLTLIALTSLSNPLPGQATWSRTYMFGDTLFWPAGMAEHPDSGNIIVFDRLSADVANDTTSFAIAHIDQNGMVVNDAGWHPIAGDSTRPRLVEMLQHQGRYYLLGTLFDGNDLEYFVAELNPQNLTINWSQRYNHPTNGYYYPSDIFGTANGDLLVSGYAGHGSLPTPFVTRLTATGQHLWTREIQIMGDYGGVTRAYELGNGELYFSGWAALDALSIPVDSFVTFVAQFSPSGQYRRARFFDIEETSAPIHMQEAGADTLGIWLTVTDSPYVHQDGGLLYLRLDSTLNLLGTQRHDDITDSDMVPGPDGGVYGTAYYSFDTLFRDLVRLTYFDKYGDVVWIRQYDTTIVGYPYDQLFSYGVSRESDGTLNLYGVSKISQNGTRAAFLTHMDSLGWYGCYTQDTFIWPTAPVFTDFVLPVATQNLTPTVNAATNFSESFFWQDPEICYSACVWPGDADNDGTAHNVDLLSIGLAYGSVHFSRDGGSNNWNCQASRQWPWNFVSNVNYKHADCNGDGFVNAADTTAILLNYGLTHNKSHGADGADNMPEIIVQIPQDTAFIGDTIHAPILLGTAQNPVDSLYGIAFSIAYDNGLVDTNTAWLSYDTTWIGTPSNTLHLQRDFYFDGKIDGAITRIDHNDTSGYHRIATLHFILIDNIEGKRQAIEVLNLLPRVARATNSMEESIELGIQSDSLYVLDPENAISDTRGPGVRLSLYPNPADERFRIVADGADILEVRVHTLQGLVVHTSAHLNQTVELKTADWAAGVYLVEVKTTNGTAYQRLMVE